MNKTDLMNRYELAYSTMENVREKTKSKDNVCTRFDWDVNPLLGIIQYYKYRININEVMIIKNDSAIYDSFMVKLLTGAYIDVTMRICQSGNPCLYQTELTLNIKDVTYEDIKFFQEYAYLIGQSKSTPILKVVFHYKNNVGYESTMTIFPIESLEKLWQIKCPIHDPIMIPIGDRCNTVTFYD